MSDPGLYTHLYAQLGDCAELVDQVIIDLELGTSQANKREREQLAALLRAIEGAPASNLSSTVLVLREKRASRKANWTEIADAIDRGDGSEAVIGQLEELARVLESER